MPRTSIRVSWRAAAFVALLIAYVLLTLAILFPSPVLTFDTALMNLHLRAHHRSWKPWIFYYVMFGQRGPATLLFLPYFLWAAWRRRSTTPLVLLGVALVLLNLSVGVVKIATGRLGPLRTHDAHDIFVGGNIYPSGHVSNTVVLYGLIAWVMVSHRKLAISAAVFLSVTVGAGTIYLDTHWFSDVIGGWIAGGLVLLALPTVMPAAQRAADAGVAWCRRRFSRKPGTSRQPEVAVGGDAPGSDDVPVPAQLPPSTVGPFTVRPVPVLVQSKSLPVSSAARAHSFAATTASLDALDDRTRSG
jgi:membrane-associated phospholipid phosphatase